jgi:hypothetical protein
MTSLSFRIVLRTIASSKYSFKSGRRFSPFLVRVLEERTSKLPRAVQVIVVCPIIVYAADVIEYLTFPMLYWRTLQQLEALFLPSVGSAICFVLL